MESIHHLVSTFAWFIPLIIVCVIWDTTWKLIGLWRAGRNNDLVWFICIALINIMGILPIIYILISKDKSKMDSQDK